ncbi:MAG: AraC family transcriptional regulator [Lentisphaeria bacterium]|nr:AraC family transcriptional regulator [Lentisphaeria bacterium]
MHTINERNIENFTWRVELGEVPIFVHRMPIHEGKDRDFYLHDHLFSEIAIIEEGEGVHHIGNSSCRITAGDVLVLHPGVLHAYSHSDDFAIANVGYDIPRLAMPRLDGYDMLNFSALFPQTQPPEILKSPEGLLMPVSRTEQECQKFLKPAFHLNPQELQHTCLLIQKLQNELSSKLPGKNLQAMALFMTLVIGLARTGQKLVPSSTRYSPRIAIIREYLNKNFHLNPTKEELAARASMSPRNFFRIFRQETGQTVGEYIRNLRIQRAYALLMGTGMPVAEIAWKCGFPNSNHFSRFFKSVNDCTPLEFRNQKKHADILQKR